MPELAEVEFNRKCWNCGIGKKILRVKLHPSARIFRGVPVETLERALLGETLLRSEARGKQMMFHFSAGNWLGLHLGMTGRLRVEDSGFKPQKHDHLVLCQSRHALVFSDMRLFGRVRFDQGAAEPAWWSRIPPGVTSNQFTFQWMENFLARHKKLSLKPALLLQQGFPGIGNWMADEIMWRAGIHPCTRVGNIERANLRNLWRKVRWVSREAMRWVGPTYSEFPPGWFFHQRWHKHGQCPEHKILLRRQTLGGRTTAWCPQCQH